MRSKEFTLMYVEDDHQSQAWMREILEDDFATIYQAYNGVEGIEMYKLHMPDIIITDISMPMLNGLDMVKKIREINKNVPVIMMSSFDDRDVLLDALNIGIDYCTPKPLDLDLLWEKLDIIIENLANKKDAENMRQKEIQNLYNLAHYDALTQIPNRFLFDVTLTQSISRADRTDTDVVLFFIDLDDFKQINDTYGHEAGDEVLKGVVENIKNSIRVEDTFARIGGDEFALILDNVENDEYIDNLAKKIINTATQPIKYDDLELKIGCSVGISKYPNNAKTKEELIKNADKAMYIAKKSGKSRYVHCKKGEG